MKRFMPGNVNTRRLSEMHRKRHADVARQARRDVEARQGKFPTRTIVDGRRDASEETVKADGQIVYLFDVVSPGARQVLLALKELAPEDTGKFKRGMTILVNGREAPLETAPAGATITLVDREPYSRRIEQGWSLQAPDGVFEVTAKTLRRRLPELTVVFNYITLSGAAKRTPAIIMASKVF